MADKYGCIFEAIVKKNAEAYETGNIEAAVSMYDDHGVVVSQKEGKVYHGTEEIKQMIAEWIKLGKVEFNMIRKAITDIGEDRFYVDVDFESKIVASGVEMRGSFHSIFHKKGDQWKCVYERYEML